MGEARGGNMTEKESITWWAELVRGLRPDEPWVVEPDTVADMGRSVVVTHCWATFTFKTFAEFVRAVTEVYNRIEAYHAGEDRITVETWHGADGWGFDLDLCVREAGLTRSLNSILEEAPSDGDGAALLRGAAGP